MAEGEVVTAIQSSILTLLALPPEVHLFSLSHNDVRGRWSIFLHFRRDYRNEEGFTYIGLHGAAEAATLDEARELALERLYAAKERRDAEQRAMRERAAAVRDIDLDLSDFL